MLPTLIHIAVVVVVVFIMVASAAPVHSPPSASSAPVHSPWLQAQSASAPVHSPSPPPVPLPPFLPASASVSSLSPLQAWALNIRMEGLGGHGGWLSSGRHCALQLVPCCLPPVLHALGVTRASDSHARFYSSPSPKATARRPSLALRLCRVLVARSSRTGLTAGCGGRLIGCIRATNWQGVLRTKEGGARLVMTERVLEKLWMMYITSSSSLLRQAEEKNWRPKRAARQQNFERCALACHSKCLEEG